MSSNRSFPLSTSRSIPAATNTFPADALSNLVDLRPAAIIRKFDLQRPIYSPFAAYGHMGREDLSAPWEACDLAPALNQALRK